jgi:hypothetical protein
MRPLHVLSLPLLLSLWACQVPKDDTASDTATGTETATGTDTSTATDTGGEQAVFTHTESSITADVTWPSGIHILPTSLDIAGGTLTIAPGSIVKIPAGGRITVGAAGGLTAQGTPDQPITFTSATDAPAAGDWHYIEFLDGSADNDNVLENVTVEFGGGSSWGSVWIDDGASVKITDSTVRNSGHLGLQVQPGGALRSFTGNSLTDNARAGVSIGQGQADLLGEGTYGPNDVRGIVVTGGAIRSTVAWEDLGVPYVMETGVLDIAAETGSAQLTLTEGVELRMAPGGRITVGTDGGLRTRGTSVNPVVITSSEPSPAPGDWAYIEFLAESADSSNELEHTEVRYAGGAGYGSLWIDSGASVAVTDSRVSDSAHYGIEVVNGGMLRDFTGNTLVDNTLAPLKIPSNAGGAIGVGTYAPNDVEGIHINASVLDDDATWLDLGVPWVTTGDLAIAASSGGSAILTVAAGNELRIGEGDRVSVYDSGALILDGTASNHVLVRSAKANPAAGDWLYIEFLSTADNSSRFTYADIRHGGGDQYGQTWVDDNATLVLDHVTYSDSDAGCDVYLVAGADFTADGTSIYDVCPH